MGPLGYRKCSICWSGWRSHTDAYVGENSSGCTSTTNAPYSLNSVFLHKNNFLTIQRAAEWCRLPLQKPHLSRCTSCPAVLICITDDIAQFGALSVVQERAKVVQTAADIRNVSPFMPFLPHGCCHLTYIIPGSVAKDGAICWQAASVTHYLVGYFSN